MTVITGNKVKLTTASGRDDEDVYNLIVTQYIFILTFHSP